MKKRTIRQEGTSIHPTEPVKSCNHAKKSVAYLAGAVYTHELRSFSDFRAGRQGSPGKAAIRGAPTGTASMGLNVSWGANMTALGIWSPPGASRKRKDSRVWCIAPFGCFYMTGAIHRTLRTFCSSHKIVAMLEYANMSVEWDFCYVTLRSTEAPHARRYV